MKSDKINKILSLLNSKPEPLTVETIRLIETFLASDCADENLKRTLTDLLKENNSQFT